MTETWVAYTTRRTPAQALVTVSDGKGVIAYSCTKTDTPAATFANAQSAHAFCAPLLLTLA